MKVMVYFLTLKKLVGDQEQHLHIIFTEDYLVFQGMCPFQDCRSFKLRTL